MKVSFARSKLRSWLHFATRCCDLGQVTALLWAKVLFICKSEVKNMHIRAALQGVRWGIWCLGGSPATGTLSHLPTDDLPQLYHLAITESPSMLSGSYIHPLPPVFVLGGGGVLLILLEGHTLYFPQGCCTPGAWGLGGNQGSPLLSLTCGSYLAEKRFFLLPGGSAQKKDQFKMYGSSTLIKE